MIILSQTTDKIQIVLAATVATNQAHCVASWRDITSVPTYTAGRSVAVTNNTTDVDWVSSPASATQRVIDFLGVYNRDTAAMTVTIKYDANGTDYTLWSGVLEPGQSVAYSDGSGFVVSRSSEFAVRVDEGATYTYVGQSSPGAANADAVWRIKRITNATTTITFADGNANFDNVWDNRASLTYD
jgi:hypothetical protein